MNKTIGKIKKLASLMLALVFFASVPSFGASKYAFGEADISYSGSVCGSAVAIAVEKGFFKEEGVDVRIVSGYSFEVQRTALATGKLAVVNGDFQFFPAVANGVNVKLIAGIHQGCIKILVPKDSPIKSAKDLKGKRIAVDEIGGTPMSVVSILVGSAGLDPQKDVQWKPFPNDQITTAAEKGEADVLALWDPFATTVEQNGKYRVISDISTDPLFADKSCCFLFASGKLLQDNPAKVAAILRGYKKATEWISKNPQEAAKILVDKKYVATKDTAMVAKLLGSYHYGSHELANQTNQVKKDAYYFADWLKKIGYLPKSLDIQKFVDGIYVDVFALEQAGKKK